MTESDLHREYARVIDMCEGTNVKPWECVRILGGAYFETPEFLGIPDAYTFALFILEDKPVFEGDKIYVDGKPFIATKSYHWFHLPNCSCCSWNPPKKKTFTLNGQKLPLPSVSMNGSSLYIEDEHNGIFYSWPTSAERDEVSEALNRLLRG